MSDEPNFPTPRALPLVSVLVPTLNRSSFLDRTIASIRAMDYENLDILISDNGSTDDTQRTLERHRDDKRIRFRRNQATIDMVSHWNQCLWEARGEYFFLLSDDDLVSTNFVTDLVQRFTEPGDVSVAMASTEIINSDDVVTQTLRPVDWTVIPGTDFLEQWLWGTGRNPTGAFLSTMMQTKAALELGGWPHFPGGANSDNALFIAMALRGSVGFSQSACFRYRVDLQSHGLKVDFEGLSESSRRLRSYLSTPRVRELLQQKPTDVQHRLQDGVSHMLARQYFYRLHSVVSARARALFGSSLDEADIVAKSLAHVSNREILRAFTGYKLDLPSVLSFAKYGGRTASRAYSSYRKRAS